MEKKENLFEKFNSPSIKQNTDGDKNHSAAAYRNKFFIILATTFICGLFFSFHWNKEVYENKLYNLVPGYNWTDQSVYAKFSFSVYKDKNSYEIETSRSRERALQVCLSDEFTENQIISIVDSVRNSLEISHPDKASDKKINGKNSKSESFEMLANNRFTKISNAVKSYLIETYKKGFLNTSLENIKNPEVSVRTRDTHFEKILSRADLTDSNRFIDRANKTFSKTFEQLDAEIALNIAKQVMHPNLIYSAELTERSREVAEASVAKTLGTVRAGELIIGKGQRLTASTVEKLKSYERAKMNAGDSGYTILTIIGSFGHAFMLLMILITYLFFIRKNLYFDNSRLMLACFIVIVSSFLSWLSLQLQLSLPVEYLVMIPALSSLASIIFDSRTAFYITVTMTMMFAGIRGNDYDAGTAMLLAGTLAAYTVRDIQSRTQIFRTTLVIFLGLLLPVLFFGLERSGESNQVLLKVVALIINSIMSPLITFGLLLIIEKFSIVSTDLTLQEYNDTNHPLLIKLNEIAPGTYQHTLGVAQLAEKCAVAVGANPLLTKVGSYYHDIGKIMKPEYFVENQIDMANKHDLLPAKKSAVTIRNHISEGLKIAKEYNLPQRIVDFIPQHHGTTLIKYFYAKALEEAEDKSTVNEKDFRYAGPKPQIKETAILMICDSAEAMSRVAGKDKAKLEAMLGGLIRDRILDGQFDECNLNFHELSIIKDVCIKNLIAGAHQRVEYKDIKN